MNSIALVNTTLLFPLPAQKPRPRRDARTGCPCGQAARRRSGSQREPLSSSFRRRSATIGFFNLTKPVFRTRATCVANGGKRLLFDMRNRLKYLGYCRLPVIRHVELER